MKDTANLAKIPKVNVKAANQSEGPMATNQIDSTKPKTKPAVSIQNKNTQGNQENQPTGTQPQNHQVHRRPAAAAAAGAPGQVATGPESLELEP